MLGLVLAAGVAIAPVVACAQSPEQIIRHLIGDPGFMFHLTHRAPAHAVATQPADTPLVDVPMPHLRPGAPATSLAYQSEEPRIVAAPLTPAPLPHISPADGPPVAADAPPLPAAAAAAHEPPAPATEVAALTPPSSPAPAPEAQGSACGAKLAELNVTAEPLPPISDGACGMPDPVKVTALAGGKVKIEGDATVDCAIATTLAEFVSDTVEPKAEAVLGGKVTALRVLDSYTCRNRDGLASGKLSEHARGNAIDIGAFEIDGKRWITVGDSDNGVPENTFLAAIRQSACGPFTTVLGPGSDSYHANHFHLDLIHRRTAGPSHGLYCR
jgi:hypothetical protein